MRTVILGERPKEIEALIESRQATGADRNDEVWEGAYHMAPAPRKRHAVLQFRLAELLGPLARQAGLVGSAEFNLGEPNDYRIPDTGLHRDASDAEFVDTAALVIEVLSPDDETFDKLPFYAAHDVDEILLVDPSTRSLRWLHLHQGEYLPTERSELLGVDVDEFARQIDWPPVD